MARVTVSTFHNRQEAEMARLALSAEGIESTIADEHMARVYPYATGIRLQVDERDVDDADTVLNRITGVAGAEYAAPSDAREWQPPDSCPSCGAYAVARRQRLVAYLIFAASVASISYIQDATLIGFFIIVAGAVFFLVAASWRCKECGHTW
jgi:hypothetical protein